MVRQTSETLPEALEDDAAAATAERRALLDQDASQVLVVAARTGKKVQLPGEEDQPRGRFTIGEPAPEDDEDWEMVPPDGGWGWLVLVGATVVNILIPGTIKSFGVLFVEFMEVFDAGQATAAWIPALCYFLYSSLGPLSSVLSVKWSYRTVTLLGGCSAALGMILSFWAFSVGYLYVSYGILVGTGAGLAFPPTVYIVTSYFVRLRGLANGICMSGSALGSIILPPVLRYLLETYGYRGAVLIMGGITLNVWAAALLFQPVEEHMIRVKREPDETAGCEAYEEDLTCETCDSDPSQSAKLNENGDPTNPKFLLTSEASTPTGDKFPNGSPPSFKQVHSNNTLAGDATEKLSPPQRLAPNANFVRSVSAAQVQTVLQKNLDVTAQDRKRKISMPASSKGSKTALSSSVSKTHVISTPSLALEAVPEGKYHLGSQETFGRKLSVARTPKRSPSTSSFQYMSTPFHGSTLSAFQQPNEFASQLTLKSITDSLAPITYCCGLRKRKQERGSEVKAEPNKFFDITLLKEPTYLVILISNCTNAISYTNFIILLPSYAITMGFDKSLAAYLISIVSALDLVGRIGGSALSDTELLPKAWYFVGGLLVSGMSLAVMPLVSTYGLISACCAVFGLASGVYVGVTALIMAEMLGTERLTSTYGISLFFNGILQLIGPPICGLWFERTRSYLSLFMTLGFILISGAALWGFMPIINRRKRLAKERELAKNQATENNKNGKASKV